MPTRNVVVTDRQAEMIDRLVKDGVYQNASEVMRDGLRLIEERAAAHATKLEAMRAAVDVGWQDLEAGRFESFTDEAALKARFEEVGRQARARAR